MVLMLVSVERWYEGGDCSGAWSDGVVMMAGVAWDDSGGGVDGEGGDDVEWIYGGGGVVVGWRWWWSWCASAGGGKAGDIPTTAPKNMEREEGGYQQMSKP
ncbi:hypothetical protein Tco_1133253 [Tanacetum coccineum]